MAISNLDRDRAFDIDNIQELLSKGRSLLEYAINVSDAMQDITDSVSDIYSEIDGEYKDAALGSTISSITGTFKKEIFQDTIDHMDRILNKLINDVPDYDQKQGNEMKALSDTLNSIKNRVNDLKGLLGSVSTDISVDEFNRRLKQIKMSWDKSVADLNKELKAIKCGMLGTALEAVIMSKDPVNLSTGNFVYDKEDIRIGGRIPLTFHRYYNAQDDRIGALGRRFSHSYEIDLYRDEEDIITIHMEDGNRKTYKPIRDEADKITGYVGMGAAKELLSEAESEENEYHYILTRLDGFRYCFSIEGKLLREENLNKEGITLSYDESGRLIKVASDYNTYLEYSYNEDNFISNVTDHTGREVCINYVKKRIEEVILPGGSAYKYRYGKNGCIEEITNPRDIVTVHNEYDDEKRIIRQSFPDGGAMTYEYDDDKKEIILTERNGIKITYVHDDKYRNIETRYHDGSKEISAYNDRNQRISYTGRNGNTYRYAYDDKGNITQIIEPNGNKTNYTYNSDGKMIGVSVNGRNKIKNTYDSKGNLIRSVGNANNETNVTYDSRNRVSKIINPDNSISNIRYDDSGNIEAITDAYGSTTTYVYDSLNRVIASIDANGNKTTYTYNNRDDLIKAVDAAGNTTLYAYNKAGKVIEVSYADGFKEKRTYNCIGKVECIIDRLGRETKFTYDKMWNMDSMIRPDGSVDKYSYDSDNRLRGIIDPYGVSTKYKYDGNGNRTEIIDKEGNTTYLAYDGNNRLIRAKLPMVEKENRIYSYEYDTEGRLTRVTNPAGNVLISTYDDAGRLIREESSTGQSIDYTYSVMGDITSKTTQAGLKTTYEYLAGGKRISKVTYPDGSMEKYTYDAVGNVKTYTDRVGVTITYTYDCLNRVTEICGENGESKKYTYDVLGNVTSITDTLGNTTRYEYTPMGKLSKVTDALGYETEYTYDECDRLIHIKQIGDGDTRQTGYERDLLGRVIAVTDIEGGREEYTYNKRGELISKLDKEENLTSFEYTPAGDISHIRYADGREVKLSYDALRKLTEIKDWLGTTKITNDALGRAVEVTYPNMRKVSYTYGDSGERRSITYPDGRTTYYGYDDNLRLSELKVGDEIITYDYDSIGRLIKKTLPNGITSEYGYDKRGLIASLIHRDDEGILDSYKYTYDLSRNKTSIDKSRRGVPEDTGLFSFAYDPIGRLSTVSRDNNLLRCYTYDAYGNRVKLIEQDRTTSYTYNSLNQLISKADEEEGSSDITFYTYDRRGNLIGVYENDTLMHSYAYDPTNRIERATNQSGEVATYIYDGLGHRVGKTMQIHTNLRNVLSVDTPNPTKRIDYLIDMTRGYYNLLEKAENDRRQSYIWDGNVVGAIDGDNTSIDYLLQDELGSTIRYTGQDNEAYAYDEFGVDILNNQGVNQPFGYTGYQYDTISDTYFAQAREYTPNIGRFDGRDIIKGYQNRPYTLNEYGYCWGNSIRLIDLTGLTPEEWKTLIYREDISDYLQEGNEAHRLLQLQFWEDYGSKGGYVEYFIPHGGIDGIKDGRADMAYFNRATQIVEVYEIKPGSYSPNSINYSKGIAQINGYIAGLNDNRGLINKKWHAEKGGSLDYTYFNPNHNEIVIESQLYENREIVYKVYEPGLITYYYRNKSRQPENVTDYSKVENKEKRKEKYLLEGMGLIVVGAILMADDALGGVIDDPIGTASIYEGINMLIEFLEGTLSACA